MKALNLGCGRRYHPAWENVDFVPAAPMIKRYDLRRGLPYPNDTFDVVYHSHLLEHFNKSDGRKLILQCHRMLKSGGVIRIAVPDLEKIVRLYLECLEKASTGPEEWHQKYEWMILEMYDQAVRERTGGGVTEFLRQRPVPIWDFIRKRWGSQADLALECARSGTPRIAWSYVLRNLPNVLHRKITRLLLGESAMEALEVGRFRRSGEVHFWMYDSYSLGYLLKSCGFVNAQRRSATESRIEGWAQFGLDSESDGKPYKPDSLYLEATKP